MSLERSKSRNHEWIGHHPQPNRRLRKEILEIIDERDVPERRDELVNDAKGEGGRREDDIDITNSGRCSERRCREGSIIRHLGDHAAPVARIARPEEFARRCVHPLEQLSTERCFNLSCLVMGEMHTRL